MTVRFKLFNIRLFLSLSHLKHILVTNRKVCFCYSSSRDRGAFRFSLNRFPLSSAGLNKNNPVSRCVINSTHEESAEPCPWQRDQSATLQMGLLKRVRD